MCFFFWVSSYVIYLYKFINNIIVCIYIYTMHMYYRYVCLILGIHILYYMHRFNTWVNESGITQPHALKCSLEQEHSQNHQNILLRPFYVVQIYMNISRQADKRG